MNKDLQIAKRTVQTEIQALKKLYESCIQFLKTRIKLDQSGFTEDIFQH